MKKFEAQNFIIPELAGISKKTIEEHLKLYAGYVKNANLIIEKIGEYTDSTGSPQVADPRNAYVLGELQRHFSFEYNGIRNHEYYFSALVGGPHSLAADSKLKAQIEKQASSFEAWMRGFETLALTRGIGWAIMYWDKKSEQLLHGWTDEQHLGHLLGAEPILMLDMWEHSYYLDYTPAEKKKYVESYFTNLNWEVVEENFAKAKI